MGALIFAGACLQGVGGIGFAMLAAPIAAIFFPQLVPGPLLAMGGCVSLLTAVRERHAIAWRLAGSGVAGRAVGGLAAVMAIAWLQPRLLAVLFALSILAAVAMSLLGWRVRTSTANLALAGTASGFLGTITSAGAPPFAIVMQHMAPAQMRATIGSILAAGSAMSIAMLAIAGRFGAMEARLTVGLLPFLLGGFLLSGRLRGRVSPAAVRHLLLTLCAAGAIAVLVREAGIV
ncbi:sulfite exporter TauE/SafE family protein [Cupriavidus sp. AU9028]|uniref:sulfite exporter TauE/SafE family protein n=1 Tax=Cupriavidus sp. AU9028 TaxID=2871157 RepID=UPI001C9433CD|nr:sulfite exporter TauE/SafE family protein [Cupriavidus sp. AU9028]MBY4899078.1 sulfite exporter TauE/SafE family protein [Cupriavidus sp. AU9028]